MNPFTLFLGGGWTGLAACLALGISIGGASAWKVQNWRFDAKQAESLTEAARMNSKRESATNVLASRIEPKLAKVRTVTKETIKEVPVYVTTNSCPLSPGFRVFHDAAAAGELPDASRVADAAAVPADTLASTIADNYGTCIENATRLTGLQDWVREQIKVK
jgi:hypothetical protein